MKNTYFIMMVAALSLWNEDVKAQNYACCSSDNSDGTDCVTGDGQMCCTQASKGYAYPNCESNVSPSSLRQPDFITDALSNNPCNTRNDVNGYCQKSAPPKGTPLKK